MNKEMKLSVKQRLEKKKMLFKMKKEISKLEFEIKEKYLLTDTEEIIRELEIKRNNYDRLVKRL